MNSSRTATVVGTEPRSVGPVLHAPPAERRVRKAGPLAQKAPDLNARIDALLETPDELHDGVVPEEDGAVRLFGRERHGCVVLGQELVELPQGRGGDTEQLASRPTHGSAAGEELDHELGECGLEQCVVEHALPTLRRHVGHDGFPVPLLELLGLGARGEGEGQRVALGAAVVQLRLHNDEERHRIGPPSGLGQKRHVVHHGGSGNRACLLARTIGVWQR